MVERQPDCGKADTLQKGWVKGEAALIEAGCLPEARRGTADRLLARRRQCEYGAGKRQPDCERAACLVGVDQSKGTC